MPIVIETIAIREGPANITIPVDQIPAIQEAIINASVKAEIIFFFIGVGVTVFFCYLYFLMWKKAKGIDQDQNQDKEPGN